MEHYAWGTALVEVMVLAADRLTVEFLRRPLEPIGYHLTLVKDVDALKQRAGAQPPRALILPRRVPGGADVRPPRWPTSAVAGSRRSTVRSRARRMLSSRD